MKKNKILFITWIAFLFCLFIPGKPATSAEFKRAILIVGDHSDVDMTRREEALKKYLVHYRQKYGHSSKTLPIFVYDFSRSRVKEYCNSQLGIEEKDLLFLGIVTARKNLPVKVHLKVIDPVNLERNAKLIVQRLVDADVAGSIKINSNPDGAKVWLGKWYKGKTPVTLRGLPAGTHIITLVKEGYRKTRKKVMLEQGQSLILALDLHPAGTQLVVTSDTDGAKVYVDGTYYGEAPVTLNSLRPGQHEVVVEKGDVTWKGTTTLTAGETVKVRGKLSNLAVVETPTPEPSPEPSPMPTAPIVSPPDTDTDLDSDIVEEAFVPRSEQNYIFRVSVSNMEEVDSIKDYYKPKPGYKFVIVYLSQQNISNEVQVYTGHFSLVDQGNTSYEPLDRLSNFWLVVLRPGGMVTGYLVFEIPQDSKAMSLVLHGLNMAPLSVSLK